MLTPRVVLVEDNTTIRETLVPALQELAGARVVAMADGAQEALATLRQVPWDVLVLGHGLGHQGRHQNRLSLDW